MKNKLLGILCLCAFALSAQLSAISSTVKLGDFSIDKTYSHDRILLDDGNVYKPVNQSQASKMRDWQLGDNILVLQNSNKNNRYLLVNTKRNEQARAKVVSLKD
jgi:hypothetical protein